MDILNEKWIYYRFEIPLIRPKEMNHTDFLDYCDDLGQEILRVACGQMFGVDLKEVRDGWFKKHYEYKNSINKNITVQTFYDEDDHYRISLRFNERTEEDNKKRTPVFATRTKGDNDYREYRFSPIQSLNALQIFHAIEFALIVYFKLEQFDFFVKEGKGLVQFWIDDEGNPMITEMDGIGFLSYPFEKRLQLYKEHPDVEIKSFGNYGFENFVKWILSKKDVSEWDGYFCIEIEKILQKYNLNF